MIIGVLQFTVMFGLVLVGQRAALGGWYLAALGVAAALFAYQQWLIRGRAPAGCFRAFLNNNAVGAVIFAGIALQYLS